MKFQLIISPSNQHPRLIAFRMDRLDLLAVQGTLKSLLQHHSSKVSILRCSAFFTVQLSHPYMTTGKTIVLTRRTFVGKVMSLLLNMLSRLVITLLYGDKSSLRVYCISPLTRNFCPILNKSKGFLIYSFNENSFHAFQKYLLRTNNALSTYKEQCS